MFIPLLIVTFTISVVVCFVVGMLFCKPIASILSRLIGEELRPVWQRYITFAIFVVGVSGGVRIWDLEKYISPRSAGAEPIVLDADRWTFEVYRTIIGTLQSIAWMLLVFFVFALVAFVIQRSFEVVHARKTGEQKGLGNGPAQSFPANGAEVPANR